MTNSSRFLSATSGTSNSPDDAAQSFLNEKLSKNRFTQKQQDTLDANGGSKNFGSQYTKVISNQDEIDAFNAKPKGDYGSLDVDMNAKFKDGRWGSGSNSKEDLANKYGLDINAAENDGETAVWGTDRSGNRVFLGNATNDIRSNADVLKAHGAQADAGEVNHSSSGDSEVSSSGDVIGAMLNLWNGDPVDPGEAPKPKEDLKKIENSPEIKQAKQRVRTYEDDILSGKTSEDIYDKYSFNATKGAAGIGTPMNGAAPQQAQKATAKFLDNKKAQVKDKYQFQAQA